MSKKNSKKVVFATLTSSRDESISLKQHGYVEYERKKDWYSDDVYLGNRALCTYRIGAHDGDKYIGLDEIDPEEIDLLNVCKRCADSYLSSNTLEQVKP